MVHDGDTGEVRVSPRILGKVGKLSICRGNVLLISLRQNSLVTLKFVLRLEFARIELQWPKEILYGPVHYCVHELGALSWVEVGRGGVCLARARKRCRCLRRAGLIWRCNGIAGRKRDIKVVMSNRDYSRGVVAALWHLNGGGPRTRRDLGQNGVKYSSNISMAQSLLQRAPRHVRMNLHE